MTFEDSRARHLGVACLFLFCAACGSTPPSNVVTETADASNHFVGTQPLYVELIRERGGSWVFTRVSDSDMPSGSGYLVRLNDLTPAFDVRAAECIPQVYPESHRCSPTHPFREKDTGMLDKIINGSIAVGTAGKVTDLSQTYETTFDEAAFNGAVDEALLNTGLDENRRVLISIIDTYDAMTSNRPYRKALTHEIACQEILDMEGTQFDPSVVHAPATHSAEPRRAQVRQRRAPAAGSKRSCRHLSHRLAGHPLRPRPPVVQNAILLPCEVDENRLVGELP